MLTEEKKKEFESLASDTEGRELLDQLLGQAQRTDKELQDRGAVYKEAPAWAQALIERVDDLGRKVDSAVELAETAKDDGEGDMEVAAEGADTADAESPQYVGDMTPEAFTALIVDAIKVELGGGSDATAKAEAAPAADATQKDDSAAQQRQSLEQQLADVTKRLKELEGDQPAVYRASAATDNIVTKEAAEAQTPVIDQFVAQWFGNGVS